MDKDLESKLSSVLDLIISGAKDATHWTLEQAPDVAREMVAAGRVKSVFAIVVIAGISAVFAMLARKAFKKAETDTSSDADWVTAFMLATVASVVLAIAALVNIYGAITIWFAPRVYLLEEAAKLLK